MNFRIFWLKINIIKKQVDTIELCEREKKIEKQHGSVLVS